MLKSRANHVIRIHIAVDIQASQHCERTFLHSIDNAKVNELGEVDVDAASAQLTQGRERRQSRVFEELIWKTAQARDFNHETKVIE